MGRQKIEMKKIEKKSSLEVTFSKRRTGLFKKAGELCVLCGAEATVIIFSPGQRAFVFGHPSVDTVINRFLEREKDSRASVPGGEVLYGHVQRQYLEALGRLEVKKENEEATSGDEGFWWDDPIESMGLNELEQFGRSLEELMKKGAIRLEEMMMMMMMMIEGRPSSTTMVEYASPLPPEYSSAGVPHGHDLATNGVQQGFEFGFGFDESLF